MKIFIVFLYLLLTSFVLYGQYPEFEWGTTAKDTNDYSIVIRKSIKETENFIIIDSFGKDHKRRFLYYAASQQKLYNVDTLFAKAQLADSLCKDITILSFKAQRYFELLQEAYLELRRLKSDSLADKLRWVEFDKRFRICQWKLKSVTTA